VSSPAVQPLLAMLACPVGGNPTQYMVDRAFLHHDLDWRYLTFEVMPEDLESAVRGMRVLGFHGVHLADPHKGSVIPLLDRTTETGTMIGSVNLVFREEDELVGDNTEGKGVLQAISNTLNPAGRQAVVLGAGRIARAVAVELAAAGAAGLTIVNRTQDRAKELVALLSDQFDVPVAAVAWQGDFSVPPETELLVHATTLGRASEEVSVPLVLDSLHPELFVADVNIGSPQTRLLGAAARRGCKTLDGLSMLVEQVAIAINLWTGVDPKRQVLREAAEEFLGL